MVGAFISMEVYSFGVTKHLLDQLTWIFSIISPAVINMPTRDAAIDFNLPLKKSFFVEFLTEQAVKHKANGMTHFACVQRFLEESVRLHSGYD